MASKPEEKKEKKLRHKFEDVDKNTSAAFEAFLRQSVVQSGATPHLSHEAASCSVQLPLEFIARQSEAVVDFVGTTLLDRHALQLLEGQHAINWASKDVSGHIAPMKTDGDGNCLAHAAALAMWGFQDRELTLRGLLYRALKDENASKFLRPRWRAACEKHDAATKLDVKLDEDQWEREWNRQVVDLASCRRREEGLPYASLEQFHVFVLAQVLRRPVVVVADDVVEGWQGDELQKSDMAGIFLPLLHGPAYCTRSPIVLAYFENHFVGMTWLTGPRTIPLCRRDGRRLPVPFLSEEEEKKVENLLDEYLTRQVRTAGEDLEYIEIATVTPARVQPQAVVALARTYGMNLPTLYKEDQQARCVTPKCKGYRRKGQDLCCTCSLRKARISPPPSPERKLCRSLDCGFFGDATKDGFCSVCFKKKSEKTANRKCATPGCSSEELEWRNFCQPCLDKMTKMWMLHNSSKGPAATQTSSASVTRSLPTRPLPQSPRLCRSTSCSEFGKPALDGFCMVCYQRQHAMLRQMDRERQPCRQSVRRDPLLSNWPFLPGRV